MRRRFSDPRHINWRNLSQPVRSALHNLVVHDHFRTNLVSSQSAARMSSSFQPLCTGESKRHGPPDLLVLHAAERFAFDIKLICRDSARMAGLNTFFFARPLSITYLIPGTVINVSAIFVVRMTFLPSRGVETKIYCCNSMDVVE